MDTKSIYANGANDRSVLEKVRKMKCKLTLITIAALSSSACTGMMSSPYQSEDQKSSLYLQADSEALKSFFEGVAGVAQVSKDSPDKQGAYWVQRNTDTTRRAIRWGYRPQKEEAK